VGRITVVEAKNRPSILTGDNVSEELHRSLSEAELSMVRLPYFPVTDESLQLFEIKVPPHGEAAPHAHTSAEIILVTAGEFVLGKRRYGPGTAIYIDADTLYGFRAGPDGASFLNFRGVVKTEYIPREQFLEKRRGR
jgi:quercetin dioxygenase-like cupin family protein